MKTLLAVIIPLLLMITTEGTENVYQYEMQTLTGEQVKLEQFKGNVLLIVNTASECGFTGQYSGLQKLYDSYKEEGLVILGFPANNFGGQEPGTDQEILQFCEVNYGVTFPMFSKIEVKGEEIHPLFEYLTSLDTAEESGEIRWNFEKFLIDRNGNLVERFRSRTEPDSDEMIEAVKTYL